MRHRHLGPKVRYRTRRNNIRYRQRPLHIQTLIFPKSKYNKRKALKWAKEHGFKHYTSREEDNSIRIRQFPPSDVKRYGGTFPIGNDIKGVYAEVDKNKYKDKPYAYLRRKFRISSTGDDDKDKVKNKDDCKPWDKTKQDSKRDKIIHSIREAEDEGDTDEMQRLENELQDYDEYIDELNKEAMEFIESEDVKMNIPPLPRKEWITIMEKKPRKWKYRDEPDEDISEMTKYWET